MGRLRTKFTSHETCPCVFSVNVIQPVFNKKDNKLKKSFVFQLVPIFIGYFLDSIPGDRHFRQLFSWRGLNESSIAQFTLLTIHKTCSLAKNKFCFKCVHGKQSTSRHFTFLLAISWHLAFEECRSTEESVQRLLSSFSKMKFGVAVAIFLAFALLVGVDSASVSLSSNQMTLNGNAHIQFYGPREEIWNGLSNGKKLMIHLFIPNPL